MTDKQLLSYIKAKAEKRVEVYSSIIQKIDTYLKSQEEPLDEPEDKETKEPVVDDPEEIKQPTEDKEPTEETPHVPVSNFKARIINGHSIHVTWTAHTDGEMDILYDTPKDKPWKHSVEKYTKPIPIQDQSLIIWYGDSLKTARLKAVIGDWESNIVEVDSSKPQPDPKPEPIKEPEKPVEDEEPIEDNPKPEQPTEKPVVEMALVFLGGESFDAWVNGQKVKDEFDYTFPKPDGVKAGVKLIKLSEKFKTLVMVKTKGHKGIKVVNRDPDNDLTRINANHTNEGDPNFWGQPAKSSFPLGVIYGPLGDTTQPEGEKVPDPLFWRGWREDPINRPNDRDFHSQWSDTGKIVISFLS